MTAAKHEQDATTATPRFLDWDRIADSPDFKALVAARRRFVTFWLVFWVALFFAWAVLTIFADDFMSSSFYESVKVGYVIATAVMIGTLVMPWAIARHGRRVDPLVRRVREQAQHDARGSLVGGAERSAG